MNKLLITSILILWVHLLHAQAPTFAWVKKLGGTSSDYGNAIATDLAGNVFSTGKFQGTADFNPGAGIFNLISNGAEDIFISKLDSAGNFIWAKSVGGALEDAGESMTIDANGNAYITGYFYGTVDFNPGVGVFNLSAIGGAKAAFILKLDTDGNFVWAKAIAGSPSSTVANDIKTDMAGNVFIIGDFYGTIDFDPNAGIYNLTSSGSSYPDIYILKLNTLGNLIWAKRIGGSLEDYGNAITLDASGNVYVLGDIQGVVDVDPGASIFNLGVSGNTFKTFILKLDPGGNFIWAKGPSGGSSYGFSIAVDNNNNNVYTTGSFQFTVDFDPGTDVFSMTNTGSYYNTFILKLDALGNFAWAKKFGNDYWGRGRAIVCDAIGDVYTTGDFRGTMDFDPGVGVYNLTSFNINNFDVFILKLNPAGNFIWAKNLGATTSIYGYSILVNALYDVYTTGSFSGTADFNPDAGVFSLTSSSQDIFIHKMSQSQCLNPTLPSVTASSSNVCEGQSTTLSIDAGSLNAATSWKWYSGSCGGTFLGSGISISVSPLSTTTYYVRGEGGCVISGTCANKTITVNSLPIVTASNVNGCVGNNISLIGSPIGGVFSLPNPYIGASTNYTYTYIDNNGCSNTSSANIIMDTCMLSLNLKLFLEGYYTSSESMTPTLMNEGVISSNTITDAIIVELHSTFSPFDAIATTSTFLNTNGTASCTFFAPVGSYYIVVKHRNTLETWSGNPVMISTSQSNYDFSIASSQAFGMNMKEIEPAVWALYSGDLNIDDNIDLPDVSILESDIANFYFGYYASDLNGDGNTDLLDLTILESNIPNFIFTERP